LLALAAPALPATRRVRNAIVTLGAVETTTWLNYMPSAVQNGLRPDHGFKTQWTTAQIFVFPLIAACGVALALRDETATGSDGCYRLMAWACRAHCTRRASKSFRGARGVLRVTKPINACGA